MINCITSGGLAQGSSSKSPTLDSIELNIVLGSQIEYFRIMFTFVCLFVYFYHCCFAGHWQVVGLVSWGLGCGEDDLPAVYVNVFHYLDFIYSSFADPTWVNIGDFGRSQTIG